MKHLSASAIVFLLLSSTAAGQGKDATVTVFGSFLAPLGKYGFTIGDNAGLTRRFGFDIGEGAGLSGKGFGLGLEFRTPVLMDGLEWAISLQGLTNPVNTTDLTRFIHEEIGDSADVQFETGSWFHIPLFTGLRYSVDLMEGARIFALLEGGVNVTREAPRTARVNGVVVEETSFRFMPDFGYQAGVGVTLFGDYELVIRYVDLGTPRYEGTRVLNEKYFTTIPRRENAVSGDPRPVTMLLLSIGYTL